jgi:hypothetical protein
LGFYHASNSDRPNQDDNGYSDHDCFCCCRHLLNITSFQPAQILNVSILTFLPLKLAASANLQPLYHPPRS